MSEDIKEQLLIRIKCGPKSALQIDESTDIAGLGQLLVLSDTVSKKTCRKSYVLSAAFREMHRE
jgi:hypothetical protein